MDDLLEYGQVQRGLLGVQILDVSAALAEDQELDVVQGVFVKLVNDGSAAKQAGIEQGDVITGINDHPVNTVSEMQEWVARNRPGQAVKVTLRRGGEERKVKAVLRNYEGSAELKKKEVEYEIEGATFDDISYSKLTRLNLDGGVLIRKLESGKWKKAGLQEDFIITHIDKVSIDNVTDLNRAMEMKKGGVLVEGLFSNGEKGTIGMEW
jgi:serine protease Do